MDNFAKRHGPGVAQIGRITSPWKLVHRQAIVYGNHAMTKPADINPLICNTAQCKLLIL